MVCKYAYNHSIIVLLCNMLYDETAVVLLEKAILHAKLNPDHLLTTGSDAGKDVT